MDFYKIQRPVFQSTFLCICGKRQARRRRAPPGGANPQRLRQQQAGRSLSSSRSPQLPPEVASSVLFSSIWVRSLWWVLGRFGSPGGVRPGPRSRGEKLSLNPGSEMDILKSEILRKRQLVEDRNLLVVRLLGVVGALATEELNVCMWGEGLGVRGPAPRGCGRGPSRPTHPLPPQSGALGRKWGNCRRTGKKIFPAAPYSPAVFLTAPYTHSQLSVFFGILLVLHVSGFTKGLCQTETEEGQAQNSSLKVLDSFLLVKSGFLLYYSALPIAFTVSDCWYTLVPLLRFLLRLQGT